MRGWLFGMTMAAALGLATVAGASEHAEKKVDCDAVAATMEEGGGGLSTDEVAKKMGLTAEQVRKCLDQVDAPEKKEEHAH